MSLTKISVYSCIAFVAPATVKDTDCIYILMSGTISKESFNFYVFTRVAKSFDQAIMDDWVALEEDVD